MTCEKFLCLHSVSLHVWIFMYSCTRRNCIHALEEGVGELDMNCWTPFLTDHTSPVVIYQLTKSESKKSLYILVVVVCLTSEEFSGKIKNMYIYNKVIVRFSWLNSSWTKHPESFFLF